LPILLLLLGDLLLPILLLLLLILLLLILLLVLLLLLKLSTSTTSLAALASGTKRTGLRRRFADLDQLFRRQIVLVLKVLSHELELGALVIHGAASDGQHGWLEGFLHHFREKGCQLRLIEKRRAGFGLGVDAIEGGAGARAERVPE